MQYPSLREVQFFANHDDSELLVELFIHHATTPVLLKNFAKLLRERMPEIAGVAVFASGADPAEPRTRIWRTATWKARGG